MFYKFYLAKTKQEQILNLTQNNSEFDRIRPRSQIWYAKFEKSNSKEFVRASLNKTFSRKVKIKSQNLAERL